MILLSIVRFTYSFCTIGSVEYVRVMEVNAVKSLRWFESHIVVAWVVVLPECSHVREEQRTCVST